MCIVRARQVTIAHAKIHGLMSQVFMHVLSAMSSKKTDASKGRFSDYKKAHLLDKSDPRWLHKKEVDMVKVVLCRFIKSQLDGISLRNAVRKTCKMNLRQAGNKADKIADALFK